METKFYEVTVKARKPDVYGEDGKWIRSGESVEIFSQIVELIDLPLVIAALNGMPLEGDRPLKLVYRGGE